MALALLLAVPPAVALGVAAARRPRLAALAVGVAGVIFTIPSLALFALLVGPLGLGTAPSLAVRLDNAPVVISDNSILQVGNELGVAMMGLFVVVLVAVVIRLWRADREEPPNRLTRAARLALIGLILAGQLHHVLQTFAVTWPLWALAGLALRGPPGRREPREHRDGQPTAAARS